MQEEEILTKEELREERDAHRWEFTKVYTDQVRAALKSDESMSDAHMYALDLCAEEIRLPISKLDELKTFYFELFPSFLNSGKCSDVEHALMDAEDCYAEQFLPKEECNFGCDWFRYFRQRKLAQIKEALGKSEDEEVELVEMAIYLFDSVHSRGWKSQDKSNGSGSTVHVKGRKEWREEKEKAAAQPVSSR